MIYQSLIQFHVSLKVIYILYLKNSARGLWIQIFKWRIKLFAARKYELSSFCWENLMSSGVIMFRLNNAFRYGIFRFPCCENVFLRRYYVNDVRLEKVFRWYGWNEFSNIVNCHLFFFRFTYGKIITFRSSTIIKNQAYYEHLVMVWSEACY